MKKATAFILAAVMAFSLCACGQKQETEDQAAGLANPVHECDHDEMVEKTTADIDAPAGAENVRYSYIDNEGEPVAQVEFTLDGKEYCYRAQSTAITSIMSDVEGNKEATPADLMKMLADGTNVGAALSGMYYNWESGASTMVADRDAVCGFNEGKAGFIAWLDVVPGYLYSLSMDDGCTQELLQNTAEACFVPMQGNVG